MAYWDNAEDARIAQLTRVRAPKQAASRPGLQFFSAASIAAVSSTAAPPPTGRRYDTRFSRQHALPAAPTGSASSGSTTRAIARVPPGCPVVGMSNRGNTCFLNSMLQCAMACPPLKALKAAGHTVSEGAHDALNARQVVRAFQECAGAPSGGAAVRVLQALNAWGSRLPLGRQHDAQEATSALLQCLILGTSPVYGQQAPRSLYKELLDSGMQEAQESDAWGAHEEATQGGAGFDALQSHLVTRTACGHCAHTHRAFHAHCTLSTASLAKLSPQGGSVSPQELVDSSTYRHVAQGYTCSRCGQQTDATVDTAIVRAAPVLVVHVHRYTADGRRANHSVRGSGTVSVTLSDGRVQRYALRGVTRHSGGTSGGHYTALVVGSDGVWYSASDSSVSRAPEGQQSSPLAAGCNHAYILWYTVV